MSFHSASSYSIYRFLIRLRFFRNQEDYNEDGENLIIPSIFAICLTSLKISPYPSVCVFRFEPAPLPTIHPQIHWLYTNTFFSVNKSTPVVPFNSLKMALKLIFFGTFVAIVEHNHLRSKKIAFCFILISASAVF